MSISDLYNKYFLLLINKASENNSFPNIIALKHGQNDNYITFSHEGFKYNFVSVSERTRGTYGQNFVGFTVELYLNQEYFDSYFEQLKLHRNTIEKEIGIPITWQEAEFTSSKNVCRIYALLDGNLEDTSKWNNCIQWQIETMSKFLNVLPKFTKTLSKISIGVLKMTAAERENAYKQYLIIKMKTSSPASSYPKMLTRDVPNKLISNGETTYSNLFECTDIKYLKTLRKRLLNHGDLHQFNIETQANAPSTAINHYIHFLEDPSLKIQDSTNNESKKSLKVLKKTSNEIKNILLYGVPGVGKTHNIAKLISLIEEGRNEYEVFAEIEKNTLLNNNAIDVTLNERIRFVTFHQNFGYEDFIEGFRPNEKGTIELQDGIFKSICQEARENRDENYYLVIDEINRGNISKIFGELITLIEEDKRDSIKVVLPYSKLPFTIPSNLFIIGTMNSTDKSIALIDIALRRRFTFVKMQPNDKLINHVESQELFNKLNVKITERLGEDYQIGHSYFMKIENDADLSFVIKYKITPLLEEYFYGDTDGLNDVLKVFEK